MVSIYPNQTCPKMYQSALENLSAAARNGTFRVSPAMTRTSTKEREYQFSEPLGFGQPFLSKMLDNSARIAVPKFDYRCHPDDAYDLFDRFLAVGSARSIEDLSEFEAK